MRNICHLVNVQLSFLRRYQDSYRHIFGMSTPDIFFFIKMAPVVIMRRFEEPSLFRPIFAVLSLSVRSARLPAHRGVLGGRVFLIERGMPCQAGTRPGQASGSPLHVALMLFSGHSP